MDPTIDPINSHTKCTRVKNYFFIMKEFLTRMRFVCEFIGSIVGSIVGSIEGQLRVSRGSIDVRTLPKATDARFFFTPQCGGPSQGARST